ncbi:MULTISPECIES: LacI family DNA-binding transcriptional regulator [Agrobacterium]|uniref:LacI family transcriptional regulator n=1 Tax=Agrobacterium tumefaciens TaxID=358 RepID=A0AAE6BIR2_AGRTU|nr:MULTISPECIES: LacI family DNA-binding transcriptional regulator [Agrobacterium]QCL77203.1 LacI family transcriptional regulator [Agrobacterium tumefaciens]QCL82711.1 LacI family transcriptional regulator [Agrobacterium tumefaciens]CUX70473.1 Transcriptional regulator [Agrobacterium sp. NCPPB 925]
MEGNGRANLKKIASELGLSVTTVSRALKDGPEVHPKTIARVKIAANAAGYVPNLHGRALRTGQTRTLSAILPLETRDYLSDLAKLPLIEGMTLAAQESGYSLSISSTTPDDDPYENLKRVIQAGSADGIIITRMVANDPRPPFLLERHIPFVAFGRSGSHLNYAYVDIDNEKIAYEAVQMLVAEGCRSIALQLLTLEDQYSAMRMAGYSRAMAEAGLEIDPRLIGYQEFTMAASERWVGKLLDLPDPMSGLICANELGLLGALSALRQRNLVPGRDVRIVVRDNTQICRYLSVPLIAHSVDMVAVGRNLVESLIHQIERPEMPPQQLVMFGELQRFSF